MSICAATLVAAGALFADPPRCNKQNLGKFWPGEANDDAAIALRLARDGELQVCSHTGWRYRWMQPSVRVDQLRTKKWKKPQQGEADRQKAAN